VAAQFTDRQFIETTARRIDPRLPQHANSLWDMEICALIGPAFAIRDHRRFNRAPVVVVTAERQIMAAAPAAGA